MSKTGKRLIAAANDALAFVCGDKSKARTISAPRVKIHLQCKGVMLNV